MKGDNQKYLVYFDNRLALNLLKVRIRDSY